MPTSFKQPPARVKFGAKAVGYSPCRVTAYKSRGVAIAIRASGRGRDNPTTLLLSNEEAVRVLKEIADALLPFKNNGRVG
jgi:hypothetical protein